MTTLTCLKGYPTKAKQGSMVEWCILKSEYVLARTYVQLPPLRVTGGKEFSVHCSSLHLGTLQPTDNTAGYKTSGYRSIKRSLLTCCLIFIHRNGSFWLLCSRINLMKLCIVAQAGFKPIGYSFIFLLQRNNTSKSDLSYYDSLLGRAWPVHF